jgi:4-hydroxy-tetrahydrodipicolinate reductase
MGSTVCGAVESDDDLELVARIDVDESLDGLVDAGAEVAVDFTNPSSVRANVEFCLEHGIHAVVGTTGLSDDDLSALSERARGAANVFVAPNFAVGAVLMMRFAAAAAPYFDTAEIVERHHEKKLDAPSGTALRTAALMNEARARAWASGESTTETLPGSRGGDASGVRIHSLRVRGSVAHQDVIFGSAGETLTIRHDSLDRASFMPGVLLAVKRVGALDGLVVGLENLLDL